MPREILSALVLVGLACVVPVIWGLRMVARSARRRRVAARPFPDAWWEILDRNLPPHPHLRREDQDRLHQLIHVFLDEKTFEGCDELELNDEIRVTIAGQACLLVMHNPAHCYYPKLHTVLVYPSTYVAGQGGLFTREEEPSVRLGESWGSGNVVLAWDSVKGGSVNFEDGHNVTFHEFAHQLDQEDGAADGAPLLDRLSAYGPWARVLSHEYKVLKKAAGRGSKTVMDRYGTTNPAEFFAVATETFFEKPEQLQDSHPELFEALKEYYRLDPREWDV